MHQHVNVSELCCSLLSHIIILCIIVNVYSLVAEQTLFSPIESLCTIIIHKVIIKNYQVMHVYM